MKRVLEQCLVEIQAERGVIYVHNGATTLIRISGLTPEQCRAEMIDVRALQPRSHNETLYGWAGDGEVPPGLRWYVGGPQAGDRVRITNERHVGYNKTGVVTRQGIRGGWYIQLDDGDKPIYYVPYGIERVRERERG